jgi:hypothetical protein
MRTPTGRKCSASETGRDLVCRCRTRRGSSRSRSHTRPRRRPYQRSRRGPSDNHDPRADVGTATGPRRWAQTGLCRFVRQPPHTTEIVVSPTRCDAPSIKTRRSLRPTGRCTRLRRPLRTGAHRLGRSVRGRVGVSVRVVEVEPAEELRCVDRSSASTVARSRRRAEVRAPRIASANPHLTTRRTPLGDRVITINLASDRHRFHLDRFEYPSVQTRR